MSAIVPYSGAAFQKGHGVGGLFRGLFRMAIPLMKSVGASLGRRAVKAGVALAGDALRGRNMKDAVKNRLGRTVLDEIGSRLGKRKATSKSRKPPAKKRKKTTTSKKRRVSQRRANGNRVMNLRGGDIFSV